jgi:hypothetical protein
MVLARSILKTKILFLRGAHQLPLICWVDYNVEFYPKQRKGSILRFTLARARELSIYSFEFYYDRRKSLALCYIFSNPIWREGGGRILLLSHCTATGFDAPSVLTLSDSINSIFHNCCCAYYYSLII